MMKSKSKGAPIYNKVGMQQLFDTGVQDAVRRLKTDIRELAAMLGLDADLTAWTRTVDAKLIPRLSEDFPVTAAICGGGSSGKSTLFNALAGKSISPVGGKAGINRRILAAVSREAAQAQNVLSALFEPVCPEFKPLKTADELTEPGCPLYALSDALPPNLVLIDTPDFDTGARGAYTNREAALDALEISDILIYLFTNANYSNKDNTDFVSSMLTRIGRRKCFLVYRADAGLDASTAMKHAAAVGHNLYGTEWERHVLGIFRVDEDNAVAAGKKPMEIRPAAEPAEPPAPFIDVLRRIDPKTLRPELISSVFRDALDTAETLMTAARISQDELHLYLKALNLSQSRCVQEALAHFPMDQVLKRFVHIWMTTDPRHIKAMRKTGDILGMPVKILTGAYKWTRRRFADGETKQPGPEFKDRLEEDLLDAVNKLYGAAAGSELHVTLPARDPLAGQMAGAVAGVRKQKGLTGETPPTTEKSADGSTVAFRLPAHPALTPARRKLKDMDWKSAMAAVLDQKQTIVSISDSVDRDLQDLAVQFREKLGVTGRIRQTLSAVLNVVPATVAVTYILHTGDPAGAAGVKVKLSGLFGLHDLYALVALPATTGLNKADRKQLEAMLGPIAKTWLSDKLKTVQEIFEAEISGALFRFGEDVLKQSDELIRRIDTHMDTCRKALSSP